MNQPQPRQRRRDWMRIGGPVLSLALHMFIIALLVQRIGPVEAMVSESTVISLADPIVSPPDDPTPAPPPEEPQPGSDLPFTATEGVSFERPTDVIEFGCPGPGAEEPAGFDLAPVRLGASGAPLSERRYIGGGEAFGHPKGLAGDLVGTMYDLKRDARGEPRAPDYLTDVRQVLAGHLSASSFGGFYRVTNQLFMTHLFVPVMPAEQGPAAFNAGDQVKPQNWMVHYRGTIRPPQAGRFRFVGMFDDLLMVLIDGKIVMEFLWTGDPTPWAPTEFVGQHPCYAGRPLVYGDWIEMDTHHTCRIDILVGEHPGGLVGGVLMIQEKNHAYALTPEGRPILPVFTVQRPTLEERVRLVRFDKWPFDPDMPVFSSRPEPKMAERADDQLTIEII